MNIYTYTSENIFSVTKKPKRTSFAQSVLSVSRHVLLYSPIEIYSAVYFQELLFKAPIFIFCSLVFSPLS